MRYSLDEQVTVAEAEAAVPLFVGKTSCCAFGNRLLLAAVCNCWFLKAGMIAGYTTEEETVEGCEKHKPSLLFVGDVLEQGYATSLIKKVQTASPETKCLLFTERESVPVVRDAISAGAAGVVFVSSIGLGLDGDFVPALKAIADGGIYYPPTVRKAAGYELEPLPDFTEREFEVLKELCLGHSNKAIAQRLILSTDTVKGYVSSVIAKLGAEDRLSAVVKAIKMGV